MRDAYAYPLNQRRSTAISDSEPPMAQDSRQKSQDIFSLFDTINHKKKHVGKNYVKYLSKLHKGVYYQLYILINSEVGKFKSYKPRK